MLSKLAGRYATSLVSMANELLFPDAQTARDVLTFAQRATKSGCDGIRITANDGVCVATAAVLASQGLLDPTPLVLGIRIARIDPELQCDLVVAELMAGETDTALALPETALAPSWAGVAPPKGGWQRVAELDAAVIATRAQWGISAVAHGSPAGSGEAAVQALRSSVWGELDEELADLPRGVAFAAHALGFISGEERVPVTSSGRWYRLSFARGHVLTRGPAITGLTAVRETG